jgi:uncharacterized RDD family membrane protein YckC
MANPADPDPAIPLAYATPAAPVVYATFGQRLLAWVIDSAVLGVIQLIALSAVGGGGTLLGKTGMASDTADAVTGWAMLGMFLLSGWAYYALMEASRWQATLGKRAVGIEVADIEGGYATWVQTSVRFVLKFVSAAIFGMGYPLCLLTRRHQTLHDIGANCVVVKATLRPPALPATAQ